MSPTSLQEEQETDSQRASLEIAPSSFPLTSLHTALPWLEDMSEVPESVGSREVVDVRSGVDCDLRTEGIRDRRRSEWGSSIRHSCVCVSLLVRVVVCQCVSPHATVLSERERVHEVGTVASKTFLGRLDRVRRAGTGVLA